MEINDNDEFLKTYFQMDDGFRVIENVMDLHWHVSSD